MAMPEERSRCSETSLSCNKTCLSTAMNHCLETGGKHVEPAHFRLMMACAEMCRTSAHFMLINTPHHKHTCKECAKFARSAPAIASGSAAWTNAWRCAGPARSAAARWRPERRTPPMKSQLVSDTADAQVHGVILDSGGEAFAALTKFANGKKPAAASM